jgi:lipopolysaccharide/colanic/teichoic acid biosynthesis glycosyltransferase
VKRIFDIVTSSVILLIFFPVGILISFAITIESRGGVFYRQERIGRYGMPFKVFKFRTMKVDSEKLGSLTVGMKDNRITTVGVFLRKLKLDEFPQFFNVLIGQMSIVGPRPEVKEYVDLYSKEQRKVLDVKPGITDYASLEYFKENELLGKSDNPRQTYIDEIMPAKLELNKKYLTNPTIMEDIKIMWKTFLKMVK